MDAVSNVPPPVNEPVRAYAPGSAERAAVEAKIKELAASPVELTMAVGGQQRMGGGDRIAVVEPHNHAHVLGHLGNATGADVTAAIEAAAAAAPGWRALSFDDRAAVFLKAADLLAGPWRATINAATMLGQSKSVYQAEIDAACELIDFWRYNAHFARRLLAEQPSSAHRRVEPAGVPAARGVRAGHHPVQLHLDRRQPAHRPGADGQRRGLEAVADPAVLGALHDAAAGGGRPAAGRHQPGHRRRAGRVRGGAARTRTSPASTSPGPPARSSTCGAPSGENIARYRDYPRLVGETGGKDFVVAHPSADPDVAGHGADPRRVRVPGPEVLGRVPRLHPAVGLGPDARRLPGPGGRADRGRRRADLSLFMGAVIDARAFRPGCPTRWPGPASRPSIQVLAGGDADGSQGYFVQPTVLECSDPDGRGVPHEFFGPVLAVYVYEDARVRRGRGPGRGRRPVRADRRDLRPGPGRDRRRHRGAALRGGQLLHQRQAHRGGRRPAAVRRRAGQGTNDKAGSIFNLTRWTNARAIKERSRRRRTIATRTWAERAADMNARERYWEAGRLLSEADAHAANLAGPVK